MADSGKNASSAADQVARVRSTPADRSKELLPWRHAPKLTKCKLYWLPITSFPVPVAQRVWLLQFLERWTEIMKADFQLRTEVFLQYKIVHPNLSKPLLNTMMDFIPIMGLGRKPGESATPAFPSKEEIEAMTKSMFDTLKREEPFILPDATKYMPDYSYWFVGKASKEQRDLFFGHSGMTLAFLKADPKTTLPPFPISPALRKKLPVLQNIDIEKSRAQAASLADSFLAKSKELFGAGLDSEPQTKGIPFVLPILDTADFFSQSEKVVDDLFQLFEVYIRESPADRGILLAFKTDRTDMEEALIELLKAMKEEGLLYPEA
jgi:hypothetical protein